jgi:hypothetical protein
MEDYGDKKLIRGPGEIPEHIVHWAPLPGSNTVMQCLSEQEKPLGVLIIDNP